MTEPPLESHSSVAAVDFCDDDRETDLVALSDAELFTDDDITPDDVMLKSLKRCAAAGNLDLLNALLDLSNTSAMMMNKTGKRQYSMTPLHYAVLHNRIEIVQALIHRGCNVRACTENHVNAAHMAAQLPDSHILRTLIEAGVPINMQDGRKQTPLIYAARTNSVACIELLLQRGALLEFHDRWFARDRIARFIPAVL